MPEGLAGASRARDLYGGLEALRVGAKAVAPDAVSLAVRCVYADLIHSFIHSLG